MTTVTNFLSTLVSFPEKVLGLLPMVPDGQKQILAGMVGGACDHINNELQGMKPVEILCVTILGVVLTRFVWNLIWFIYSNMTLSNIQVALFRFAAKVVP